MSAPARTARASTVHEVGEAALIERMTRGVRKDASVRVGIGDDAAVLAMPGGRSTLFASDMVVEGVHFRLDSVPPYWIGWKALAANVSDIAAMGGCPRWVVVSLGLPPTMSLAAVDELSRGLRCCARRFGVSLVGGDTVRSTKLVVDVAILGVAEPGRVVLRSGARVGDWLFVTGRLGGSYRSGRHARFSPRLHEARELVRRVKVHAMMDLSDGLAQDAWRMSRASRVRMRLEAARIPVAAEALTLRHALTDGEDFELLFAVSPRQARRLPARVGRCPLTRIGTVVARGVGVELMDPDGRIAPLTPSGFRHF